MKRTYGRAAPPSGRWWQVHRQCEWRGGQIALAMPRTLGSICSHRMGDGSLGESSDSAGQGACDAPSSAHVSYTKLRELATSYNLLRAFLEQIAKIFQLTAGI